MVSPAVRLIRRYAARPASRALLGLFLAACLLMGSAAAYRPMTPAGVHCPTAPVQRIRVTEWQVADCGHATVRTVERAPRPAEAGFKQCRCAESHQGHTATWGKSLDPPAADELGCSLQINCPVLAVGRDAIQDWPEWPNGRVPAPLDPPPNRA